MSLKYGIAGVYKNPQCAIMRAILCKFKKYICIYVTHKIIAHATFRRVVVCLVRYVNKERNNARSSRLSMKTR